MNLSLYKQFLRAARKIDISQDALNAALQCFPSSLYSHHCAKNIKIDIGTKSIQPNCSSLSEFILANNILGKSPFAQHIEPKSNSKSFVELVNKYARTCTSTQVPESKDADNVNQLQHILQEFELLASASQKISQNHAESESDKQPSKNFADLTSTNYIIPTIDASKSGTHWRASVFLQHPVAANPFSHLDDAIMKSHGLKHTVDTGDEHQPLVMVGIDIVDRFDPVQNKRVPFYKSLVMNRKTLLDVSFVVDPVASIAVGEESESKTKYVTRTSHGNAFVPEVFHQNPLFLGGDCTKPVVEVLTTNQLCKGLSVLNGAMFWNPDLRLAEKLIDAGVASADEFKFFYGHMSWNETFWENIQERKLFSTFRTPSNYIESGVKDTVRALMWQHKNMWSNVAEFAPEGWRPWIQLFDALGYCEELREIKLRNFESVVMKVKELSEQSNK